MNKSVNKKYSGVIIPIITPIHVDQTIDQDSLDAILKTFTSSQVSVFLLGTTGESASIPKPQKDDLVKWTVKKTNKQITIYAGISGNCLEESINNGNHYADLGVDALVAHLPNYYPVSTDEMIRYFETIASAVKLPLILYNNPATARWSLPLAIIDKLSHHENIVGIKDSERGIERMEKSIQLWSSRTDFSYLLGWAAQSANATAQGCDGIVPSMGNLVPELYQKLFDAALNGRLEEAEKLQQLTDELSAICQKDKDLNRSIPALKSMLAAKDLCKPYVFPPMSETEEKEQILIREKTRQILESITNLVK